MPAVSGEIIIEQLSPASSSVLRRFWKTAKSDY